MFLETMGAIEKGPAGQENFTSIMGVMDADGDGQIDFEEFVEWFLQQKNVRPPHSPSRYLWTSLTWRLSYCECRARIRS